MMLPGLKQQRCGHVIASITAGSLVIKSMLSKMGKPKVIRMEAKHTKRMCLYVISCIYTSVNIIKYTIQTMSYK